MSWGRYILEGKGINLVSNIRWIASAEEIAGMQ